jgi:hypothetical protein
MRSIVFGLAVAAIALVAAPALAAPNVVLPCPSEARGTVTHNGDAGWIATNQSSRVSFSRVEQIGGETALVCVYRMFGGDYWIYRRPPADYPRCRHNEGSPGFYCTIP